mmetsp:Transcript_7030/g.11036  ORF Transcript_7030/g.11036 Transcript_7030/m.11036 type:complete len:208 (-) Transcript_7030:492-1115(-)
MGLPFHAASPTRDCRDLNGADIAAVFMARHFYVRTMERHQTSRRRARHCGGHLSVHIVSGEHAAHAGRLHTSIYATEARHAFVGCVWHSECCRHRGVLFCGARHCILVLQHTEESDTRTLESNRTRVDLLCHGVEFVALDSCVSHLWRSRARQCVEQFRCGASLDCVHSRRLCVYDGTGLSYGILCGTTCGICCVLSTHQFDQDPDL